MQMYYFYGLTSVLASIGGSGQLRVAWRIRIGLRFDRKLKKRFGLSSRAKRGICFLPDRKENTYSLERA